MYINGTDIWEVRDNTVTENGDAQEVYANNCKKLCSIRRPVCKKITTKSTDVAGTADGGYTVTVYACISGSELYREINKSFCSTHRMYKRNRSFF